MNREWQAIYETRWIEISKKENGIFDEFCQRVLVKQKAGFHNTSKKEGDAIV